MKKLISALPTVLFLLFIGYAYATLKVIEPAMLKNEFLSQSIKYSLANFGHIPYGQSQIGPLMKSEPFDACSPLQSNFSSTDSSPILMVSRGNCSFVTKVKHAQLLGARAVIIMDIYREKSEDMIMMDDGHGSEIRIPSALITEEDGKKLLKYLDSQDKDQNQVVLVFKFDLPKQDHVNYTFWLNLQNNQSFELVKSFSEINQKLGQLVTFTPHYAAKTCHSFLLNRFNTASDTCQLEMDEIMRQICIYQVSNQTWWKYMAQFGEQCQSVMDYNSCSKNLQLKLGLNDLKIEQCIYDNFVQGATQGQQSSTINPLILNEITASRMNGVKLWPSVQINKEFYRGQLQANYITEAICDVFNVRPQVCLDLIDTSKSVSKSNPDQGYANNSHMSVTLLIVIIIVVIIAFITISLLVYKSLYKNEIRKEMSSQVNELVKQYIQFYENRDKDRTKLLDSRV